MDGSFCSFCGKNCGECSEREKFGCCGCKETRDGYWGGICEIKECCAEKKIEHCGECKDFPCAVLRGFCYDKETGDDGERLLQCKKWADNKKSTYENRVKRYIIFVLLGILTGVVVGIFQGRVAAWLFCFTAVGFGIALMLDINGRK